MLQKEEAGGSTYCKVQILGHPFQGKFNLGFSVVVYGGPMPKYLSLHYFMHQL